MLLELELLVGDEWLSLLVEDLEEELLELEEDEELLLELLESVQGSCPQIISSAYDRV